MLFSYALTCNVIRKRKVLTILVSQYRFLSAKCVSNAIPQVSCHKLLFFIHSMSTVVLLVTGELTSMFISVDQG